MKKKIDLILNIAIVVMEIIATTLSITRNGLALFQFYTEDSNMFAGLVYLIYSYYLIKKKDIPEWLNILKFTATCILMVTFLVVIFVLAPIMNGGYVVFLLYGSMLYQHLLCPIVLFVSYVFLEKHNITNKYLYYSLITTIIYAIVSVILNILKFINGPYPFLHVYNQPVFVSILWIIGILGGAYLIALSIKEITKRVH
jgi:hypothetical protein